MKMTLERAIHVAREHLHYDQGFYKIKMADRMEAYEVLAEFHTKVKDNRVTTILEAEWK